MALEVEKVTSSSFKKCGMVLWRPLLKSGERPVRLGYLLKITEITCHGLAQIDPDNVESRSFEDFASA